MRGVAVCVCALFVMVSANSISTNGIWSSERAEKHRRESRFAQVRTHDGIRDHKGRWWVAAGGGWKEVRCQSKSPYNKLSHCLAQTQYRLGAPYYYIIEIGIYIGAPFLPISLTEIR